MLYRLYKPADFAALYAIEEACFEPLFRFGRRYMRQLIDCATAATWIAEEDGRMAGFAIVEWSEETTGTIAYIQTLEVAPDWRVQGIGGELLRSIEGSAQDAGAQAIWLHVHADNAAAIRLYQTRGYLSAGREENYYARGMAALVCIKPLDTIQEQR
ncbi:MAG: N-acetyltransferase [Terracidiphilus sp.]|nr:N-acetyltransferase [Terracidiphilus sp.]